MEKITSREILHQIREEAAKKISDSRCRILICAGTGCLAGGSGEIYRRMSELAEENPDIDVEFGPEIAHGSGPLEVKKSGCRFLNTPLCVIFCKLAISLSVISKK